MPPDPSLFRRGHVSEGRLAHNQIEGTTDTSSWKNGHRVRASVRAGLRVTTMRVSREPFGAAVLVSAAGLTVTGALLPWSYVHWCWELCRRSPGTGWNVLQLGGGWAGPSSFTATGIVILTAAAVQIGAAAALTRKAHGNSRRPMLGALAASVAILLAWLLAPVPPTFSNLPAFFWHTNGVGEWFVIAGGVIGAVVSSAALFALSRGPRALIGARPSSPMRQAKVTI